MDVALRATDVQLSRRLLIWTFLAFSVLSFPKPAQAIEESKPIHYSADRQLWNRKDNKVELFNHAVVRQPGETLNADYVMLDLNARTIDARGNCVYIAADSVIYGEEMHFNLETRTGSIVNGRVSNDRFSLSGERINKLGDQRFQTHWGDYSTCRDCPQSWAFQAEDVDMQIEGYAFMSNVTAKIKDAPAVWLPYLVIPMKTRRQTGLLFPRIGTSNQNGFIFVQPFFWAINRSSDMTFSLGTFSAKGMRAEWEGRYVLSGRSAGKANLFYLKDHSPEFINTVPNRWALDVAQTHELAWGVEGKFRFTEVSDNLYPTYIGDVPGAGEAVIPSTLSFSYASPEVSSYIAAKRFRNLLNTNPDPLARLTEFDPRTVQAFPTAVVTTNDKFLLGTPVAAGLTLGATNFTRSGPTFDYDQSSVPFGSYTTTGPAFRPGFDPIRKATRVSITPSVYSTLRPFDVLSVVPSLKYYSYFYSFHNTPGMPNLYRGYLLFQTDLSAQLERIYDTENPDIPRTKHLIRPLLTYSYIPYVREDNTAEENRHPFLRQIKVHPGYNFDNNDIVPLDASPSNVNYFVPLGNSLAYGLTTQFIRRRGKLNDFGASYERTGEFTAGQALNFRDHQKPLSRFFSALRLGFDKFSAGADYTYTPYLPSPRSVLSTSLSYTIERSVHQRILAFDRSITASYNYNKLDCDRYNCGTSNLTGTLNFSLSDFVLPSFSTSFDLNEHRFFSNALNIAFQSPSRCWRFTIGFIRHITTGPDTPIDFSLNITGSGFSGVSELATQAAAGR